MSEKKSKNTTVKESEPIIKKIETVEEVNEYTAGDTRDTVKDAAEKRIKELEEASNEAETVTVVEVPYDYFVALRKALTEKINDDKRRRGMSQPSSVDQALIDAKTGLDGIIK